MKKLAVGLSVAIFLSAFISIAVTAHGQTDVTHTPVAQGPLRQVNPYYSTQSTTYDDGETIVRHIIKGPPKPPAGFERQRAAVSVPLDTPAGVTLAVPAYQWVFGCSAVSGAMIAGYYDRNGFPEMYTGPTGGGVMPLIEDGSWGTWTDGTDTYPNNPLIASHNGLDGRTTKGSIDDYWVQYNSAVDDPYVTGKWRQHTWGLAIGDYMKTSQSAYDNTDGSTTFSGYFGSATKFNCSDMPRYGASTLDGTYGRKLFYEAKGYTVTECYNQTTDNVASGGFSFAQYKAEIDAGHPVMLNLDGHTIVGVGYDDSVSTDNVYIHDTWDNSIHTMTWGGSYSGMDLLSVSIATPKACTYAISPPTRAFTYKGGTVNFTVTAKGAKNCPSPTVVASDASLITATLTSWSKTRGTLRVTVPENTTTTRKSGTVTIQDQATLAVSEAGAPCSISISPLTGTPDNTDQPQTYTVTATPSTCAWASTLLSGDKWGLSVTSGSGTGTNTVTYHVPANGTKRNRVGTIKTYLTETPAKNKVFRVIQSK